MMNKLSASRNFVLPVLFFLLLNAPSGAFAKGPQCTYAPWDGLGRELLIAIKGQPQVIKKQKLEDCTNPGFNNWQVNGSQNLPVMSAAIGLYRTPNGLMRGGGITYLDWWVQYLRTQVGQQAAPNSISNLRFFKGTEYFSNVYDTVDLGAALAVRLWAYKNRGNPQIDQDKVNKLIDASFRFLRAHWAIYGLAAGSGPAWTYDMGLRPDGSPGRIPIPNPRPNPSPKPSPNIEYNPAAPRASANTYYFSGNFIALAGTRSHLGYWVFDQKMTVFARAIERIPAQDFIASFPAQRDFFREVELRWQGNSEGQNVYGLTASDRDMLYKLTQDQFDTNVLNYLLSWLYDPPRVSIRLATTYRILGWNGFRASMMEKNKNGRNMYAISYKTASKTATFLFPWGDTGKAGLNGWCQLEPPPQPGGDAIIRANNTSTTNPIEVTMKLQPPLPRFQLVLSEFWNPQFITQGLTDPPKGTSSGSPSVFTPPDPEDIPWVAGDIPGGGVAGGDLEGWNWVDTDPVPVARSYGHQSSTITGMHQHYFSNATETLSVKAGDRLYAWVYLDPVNPPTEVMLQWNDGTWEHRAFWGEDQWTSYGVPGTSSRQYMGPLPPVGQWALLEVPASMVGLEGRTLNGMAFTLFNGRATWDEAGKTTQGGPAINLASGKAATQSSTAVSAPASRAVDGNTNGNFSFNSVTHTDYNSQAWWQVDLGDLYSLDQVRVWNRTDCCPERLSNFYVLVSDTPFTSTNLATTLNQEGVSSYYVSGNAGSPSAVATVRSGRYVRVQLAGANYLSLAEVEVLGQPGSLSSSPPPPPSPASVNVQWVQPGEYNWGSPNTLTVAGFAQNGTGGVQMVWSDETDGTVPTAAPYEPLPYYADNSWSNTIPSPNRCHTFRVYANYSGVRSADYLYNGLTAGYCTESVTIDWLKPQWMVGDWAPPNSLVIKGTAANAPPGYVVTLWYRDLTAVTAWKKKPYAPAPDSSGNWFNALEPGEGKDNYISSHKYEVKVTYDVKTTPTCVHLGNDESVTCPQ